MRSGSRGCLIAGAACAITVAILVVAIVEVLTPRDFSKESPQEVFEQLVCKPIPSSVRDIKASGRLAFAGGGAWIEFTIDEVYRPALLAGGRFTERTEKHDNDPFKEDGGSLWYERKQEGMNEEYLYFQNGGKRAAFEMIHY